ncbi:uncharacterized protein METZ01_LOCUS416629, partial [marine metagenome]
MHTSATPQSNLHCTRFMEVATGLRPLTQKSWIIPTTVRSVPLDVQALRAIRACRG